jgi:hypothetical protein
MMRARLIVLATLAALVVGTVALAGVAWAAEGGGAPPLAATTDESALCLEPETAIGDSTTNTFTTTTNVFRVNYDGTGFDPAPPGSTATIRIQTTSGQDVAFQTIDANESASFIVNALPGTYIVAVDIDPESAENKTYTVSVDQCRETTTAPKVLSTFPRNGGEVGPAANVTATFSEDMREASVTNAFKLFRKGSTNQIAAAVTYDAATDIATLNPTNNLRRGVTYKAVMTTVAKDVAGNRLDQDDSRAGLQQKVWFFEID